MTPMLTSPNPNPKLVKLIASFLQTKPQPEGEVQPSPRLSDQVAAALKANRADAGRAKGNMGIVWGRNPPATRPTVLTPAEEQSFRRILESLDVFLGPCA